MAMERDTRQIYEIDSTQPPPDPQSFITSSPHLLPVSTVPRQATTVPATTVTATTVPAPTVPYSTVSLQLPQLH